MACAWAACCCRASFGPVAPPTGLRAARAGHQCHRLAVLSGMPYVEQVYTRYAGHGMAGVLLRGAVAGAVPLPPTLLMGATLPAICLG